MDIERKRVQPSKRVRGDVADQILDVKVVTAETLLLEDTPLPRDDYQFYWYLTNVYQIARQWLQLREKQDANRLDAYLERLRQRKLVLYSGFLESENFEMLAYTGKLGAERSNINSLIFRVECLLMFLRGLGKQYRAIQFEHWQEEGIFARDSLAAHFAAQPEGGADVLARVWREVSLHSLRERRVTVQESMDAAERQRRMRTYGVAENEATPVQEIRPRIERSLARAVEHRRLLEPLNSTKQHEQTFVWPRVAVRTPPAYARTRAGDLFKDFDGESLLTRSTILYRIRRLSQIWNSLQPCQEVRDLVEFLQFQVSQFVVLGGSSTEFAQVFDGNPFRDCRQQQDAAAAPSNEFIDSMASAFYSFHQSLGLWERLISDANLVVDGSLTDEQLEYPLDMMKWFEEQSLNLAEHDFKTKMRDYVMQQTVRPGEWMNYLRSSSSVRTNQMTTLIDRVRTSLHLDWWMRQFNSPITGLRWEEYEHPIFPEARAYCIVYYFSAWMESFFKIQWMTQAFINEQYQECQQGFYEWVYASDYPFVLQNAGGFSVLYRRRLYPTRAIECAIRLWLNLICGSCGYLFQFGKQAFDCSELANHEHRFRYQQHGAAEEPQRRRSDTDQSLDRLFGLTD